MKEYKAGAEAFDTYKEYREKEVSGAIAKPVSLGKVIEICKAESPKTILEIGGGMGTLTEVMLKNSEAHIDVYEPDEFCRTKMDEHLKEFNGRYSIVPSYRFLPPRKEYDLMVVDGGTRKGKDGGYTKMIWLFTHYLDNVKTIYVEGNRALQRIMLRRALKSRFTYTIERYKAIEYKGTKLPGGSLFKVREEKSRMKRWINFLKWEVKEKRAIKYFIRYRIKKLKSLLHVN